MPTPTTIKQLNFSDLYLGHPTLCDRFSDVPGIAANPIPSNSELRIDLDRLIIVCQRALQERPSATEFKVAYDDVSYRVTVMETIDGQVFILRKIAETIYSLFELGIPKAYIRCLTSKEISGLFVISGAIKSGKTTTACAMIKESLLMHGGVAVTSEATIELPIEGAHGKGICYQTSFQRETRSPVDAFRQALRWGARTIFIDEIRDHELAAEALQASLNGHLVITTMLAANVIQTVHKLHALANEKLAPGVAQILLADGLLGVLNQHFISNSSKNKLETEFLFLKDEPVIRTILRNGKYELLGTEIKRQMGAIITENATAQRLAEV